MISSVTLPKFGSSQINQNKAMEKPDFKGDNTETDKNVNYKDWAKKNAAKIALGATALAGVVAAGILMRGRGSSIVNDLEELQSNATQALNNTLEKFRQEGNIFRKGTAITKDGERYTGELVNTRKDGSNVIMTFEDGRLRNSKIVKNGETIVDKSYSIEDSRNEYLEVAGKKFRTGKITTMEINGERPLCFRSGYAMQRENVRGYLKDACIQVPHDKPSCPFPETITIGGKKLKLSREFMNFSTDETNGEANTGGFVLNYWSADISDYANNFMMTSSFDFVKGKKLPTYMREFTMRIKKFKEEFGTLDFEGGSFFSGKKNDELFKYNYHTKEISDLNGISKEDAQEIVDFWERHYAVSKKILHMYSKQKYDYRMR